MTLSAFLNPIELKEEKDVVISTRFRDENGKVVPFRIQSLSQEENEAISKKCRRIVKIDGQKQETFDGLEYNRRLIVAATVNPDFSAKDLCDRYGVLDPLMVPAKMLTGGEYGRVLKEIMELCDFDEIENLEEEAKN